ncbi:MAG: hypothetical protein AB8G95_24490 [Anaerolineae bacterium]
MAIPKWDANDIPSKVDKVFLLLGDTTALSFECLVDAPTISAGIFARQELSQES